MKDSEVVINPSKFEGWSTTVEEAKSLGKNIILSDIPVHREQNPKWGIYFDPNNPNQLASIIKNSLNIDNEINRELRYKEARSELNDRYRGFAKDYEKIVFDAISYK